MIRDLRASENVLENGGGNTDFISSKQLGLMRLLFPWERHSQIKTVRGFIKHKVQRRNLSGPHLIRMTTGGDAIICFDLMHFIMQDKKSQ